jgi:hypothetical protein
VINSELLVMFVMLDDEDPVRNVVEGHKIIKC